MKRLENVTSYSHISRKEDDEDYGKCIFCCGKFSEDAFEVEWIYRLGCNDWRREVCYEAKHKIQFMTVFLLGVFSKITCENSAAFKKCVEYMNIFLFLLLSWVYTYLLTYSMVQSPSCKANWFAASQEIPRILWNPKVHYRTHKRPPPVSILGQPNPVHIPTSHLPDIHPNIIHPSTPGSPQ